LTDTVDKIDNNIKGIVLVVDLDHEQENKETINNLVNKIENINEQYEGKGLKGGRNHPKAFEADNKFYIYNFIYIFIMLCLFWHKIVFRK
jgi:hypothetical protein